jgi:SAM-dependent methyltransferase
MQQENLASLEYHLGELEIATTKGHARRSLPEVPAGARRVLDVGCGIGQSLVALEMDATVEAHGVDIDAAAIAYGTRKFPALHLKVSAGERLPYPDSHFDLVMCRVALPYMHVPSALDEFSRVLRDGGLLWLAVHPLSMLKHDMGLALKSRSLKGVVYRGYTLINSLLLTAGVQVRFPFNRSRIESYQFGVALTRALRRAGFRNHRRWLEHGSSLVAATRVERP